MYILNINLSVGFEDAAAERGEERAALSSVVSGPDAGRR
jgi:hypothetical protein